MEFLLLVKDKIIPAVIAEANKEEPPYDKNGNVIPLVGIRSVLLAIWIKVWKPNWKARPPTAKIKKRLLLYIV